MVKNIFKELILVLLLCLAIILVLGIGLYKYVPLAKTVPAEVAYTTPAETKSELAATEYIDESQIVMTYTVNASDLNNYQRIQDYKPGKANPFGTYEQNVVTDKEGTTTGNSNSSASSNSNSASGSNNSSSSTTSSGTNSNDSSTTTSGGTFFQDKGTK